MPRSFVRDVAALAVFLAIIAGGLAASQERLAEAAQTVAPSGLGWAQVVARLEPTVEQERIIRGIVKRRLRDQAVLLEDKTHGLSQAEIERRLLRDREDADAEFQGVLNEAQWAEWRRVEDQLGAQLHQPG